MNDKLINKMEETATSALSGDMGAMCKLIFLSKKECQGTLKQCLQQYDSKQLTVMCRFICNDEINNFKKMKKNEKIEFLEKKIIDYVENELSQLSLNSLDELNDFVNNGSKDFNANILLGMGIIYYSIVDGEEKYYIPSDVKKILKKNLNSKTYLDSQSNNFYTCLIACHYIYGLVSKDLLLTIYKQNHNISVNTDELFRCIDDKVEKITIKDQEYYWPNIYPIVEEVKTIPKEYATVSYNEAMMYLFALTTVLDEIVQIINIPLESQFQKLLVNIVLKPKTTNEIIEVLDDEYYLNVDEIAKINECLMKFDNIRFWELGGKTLAEEQLKYFILAQKPKDKLDDCLKNLSSEAKEVLCQRYSVDSVENIGEKIIESLLNEDYSSDDNDEIIDEHEKEYNKYIIDPSEIISGYFYLYKENNKIKVFVPKEIRETLLNDDIDSLDLIEAYMMLNGMIKRTDLQKLLKEHHNQDLSINELNQMILNHNCYIIDDYYSVTKNLTEFERNLILKPKAGRNYKIVDENVREKLDLINDAISQIRYYLSESKMDQLSQKYFLGTVMMLVQVDLFSSEALKALMKKNNTTLEENILNKIVDYIYLYKNDIPLWTANGFTKKEINNMNKINKKEKIGRNNPCPCGSGKKYKKCCGR